MDFQGLHDQVLGNIKHGKKPGQQPYLNIKEETDLATFGEVVANIGFGKTRKQIKAMVEKTACEKNLFKEEQNQ